MFGSQNKARKSKVMAHTLISAATELKGDLNFDGELIVEGRVTGDISAPEDSNAVLRVAEQGMVEGDINVPHVVINGVVKGDIHAGNHIELAAKASITGDVHYHLIEMVMGARVNGSLLFSGEQPRARKALTYQHEAAETDKPAVASQGNT
ncbi:MAG: cell shape determination protein CcmA [Gammaproteobacteria bacterium]|nr:cell shape determination protein CcmA [Gammaproteobacteria bacterium]|tara:strand:+ start:448 stop:900 length:453 start_codon:yes stop_codon:yes gene_type:complete